MRGIVDRLARDSRARLFPALVAAVWLASCQTVEPRAVSDVSVAAENDNLVITWSNPIDYEDVDVEVTGPHGKRLSRDRVFGHATRTGPARAVVLQVGPGTYRVRVNASVNRSRADTRRASEEVTCRVPEPVSGGYVTREDLALAKAEPLDIVFFIHPGSSYSGRGKTGDGVVELFRQMTAGVLSEAFRTAIRVPDEIGFKRIEDYRDQVATDIERASWPLDPDVLIVVDARAPTAEVPGQLCWRILDLKLAEVFGKAPDRLDRELYNRRPLVIEEYQRLGSQAQGSDLRAALRMFRDAWRGLLHQTLAHPRYRYYSEVLAAYKRDRRPAAVADKDALQTFMFDLVPASMRPFDASQTDADQAATVFRNRARKIERDFLFGPGIGGPLVAPPAPEPGEATPGAGEKPGSTAEKANTEPGRPSGDARNAEAEKGPPK
jgi:hypothetical protein